jgi:SAM-dependent methyltransferase
VADRTALILERIDLANGHGVEIGPLHHPIVCKAPGVDVSYVDHADTATLLQKYADDPNVEEIVPVDFVWGDHRLVDAVAAAAPFDFVIASHVLEHAPDPIGWLNELTEVIRPGGVVSLAIPDKRYCFDARREPTGIAEVVDGYIHRRRRPTTRQIYDFWANIAAVDTEALWRGEPGWTEDYHYVEALARCQDALSTSDYMDVHCTTWTPASFVDIMRTVFELGFTEVAFTAFHPTEPDSLEFFATFERIDPSFTEADRRARQLASVPVVRESPAPTVATQEETPENLMEVSALEARLIAAKRRTMTLAREGVARARQRGHET